MVERTASRRGHRGLSIGSIPTIVWCKLRHNYATLDAMRGTAAIAVVLYHLGALLYPIQLAERGYLAVDFFFVLSGFIVAYAYEERLEKGLSRFDFFLIRLIRFYPLYIVGLLIALIKALAQISIGDAQSMDVGGLLATVLLAIGFLPSPFGRLDELFPLNVAAWSLFLELTVNIAYAIARPRLSNICILAILIVSGSMLTWEAFHSTSLMGGAFWSEWWTGIFRVTFSFFMGVLLYRKRADLLRHLPNITSWMLLSCLAALLAARIPTAFSAWYDLIFIVLLSPALVMLGAKTGNHNRGFTYLGLISYPLYVIHEPIAIASRQASQMTGIPPVAFAVMVGVALACATPTLVYFIDLPARRWLTAHLIGRRPLRVRIESSARL